MAYEHVQTPKRVDLNPSNPAPHADPKVIGIPEGGQLTANPGVIGLPEGNSPHANPTVINIPQI